MDVVSAFIPDAKPSELVEPRMSPFDDPAVESEAAAVFGPAFRDKGFNPAVAESFAVGFGIVSSVGVEGIRSPARTTGFPPHGRNGIDQGNELGHIVGVGASERGGQGNPLAIGDHVVLTARLRAIRGIRAGFRPPKRARTEQLSVAEVDQSIASACPNSSSRACQIFCQTPAVCQ